MAVKVTAYLTQGEIEVREMPEAEAHDLVDAFRFGTERTLTLDLTDPRVAVHIARAHVVRIDVEDLED